MKKRKSNLLKGWLTILCFFIFCGLPIAQTNDLQIVAVGGGYSVTSQMSMSYTIREISISTQSNTSLITTQGLHGVPLLINNCIFWNYNCVYIHIIGTNIV